MKMTKTLAHFASAALLVLGSIQAYAADSKVGTVVEDSVITTKLKAKMVADKEVSALNISVETKDGIVSLAGNVNSEREAVRAVEIAASTEGVKDINVDGLAIKGAKQPVTDSYITAKVKGTFIKEKLFGDQDTAVSSIHVETKNGVVMLTGTANNQMQATNAENLAKSVKGVVKVENKIIVKD